MLLKDLRQNVAQLKGVGAKACSHLNRLQIRHISQLLQHYPSRYLDHLQASTLQEVWQKLSGQEDYFYVSAQVLEHGYIKWRAGQQALKIIIAGKQQRASLLCFGRNFLAAQFPLGSSVLVAGKFYQRYGQLQSSSFVIDLAQTSTEPLAPESGAYNGSEFNCLLPIYPLTQGLTQKQVRAAIAQALQHFSFAIQDEIPPELQSKYDLLTKKEALRQLHFPASKQLLTRAHHTLVYEELLLLMLQIQRRRQQQNKRLQGPAQENFSLPRRGQLLEKAKRQLPFTLTAQQEQALEQILHKFTLDLPMNCLLQGDVGSGKTIIALLSALPWLEAKSQVVLMAPTEILARQLWHNFASMQQNLEGELSGSPSQVTPAQQPNLLQAAAQISQALGQCAFLAGSVTGAKRQEILRQLRHGEVRLLVGTHALFSQQVEFANLRYIIVDEQQRFGVAQRLALKHKAPQPPHVLLMSATPIPRTLALTLYGDLEIISIRGMPAQRLPIKTHLVRQGNDAKVYSFVQRQLAAKRQAYFIYPLIERDEELRSIEQMQEELARVFRGYRLGVSHGQLPQEQKDAVMQAFRRGEIDLLLATTVVEVGVDVANASVIVIEHAERFGLAQLHQLRGRVGRGSWQSYCFLVYREDGLTDLAKSRLLTLKDCADGFAIAEQDLQLRGPGDLLGREQSGAMELRLAQIPQDLKLLEIAQGDAAQILAADYALLQANNQGLRQSLLATTSLEA